ncbi:MAG: hypothetical protein LBS62_12055 [Clostridiales bacterium]|nr:hypothetical protein [Clostridiales bacterium]
MQLHNIDLAVLTAHGKAQTKFTDGALECWTAQSVTSVHNIVNNDILRRHCVSLPEKYSLPFHVDMTVKLDYPQFWLLVGGGRVAFGSLRDNRKIEDIAFPSGKPNQDNCTFDNRMPLGGWVDISVTFNLDETQILIDGEERFYSRKLAYMSKKKRLQLDALNKDGFAIDLVVTKLSTLSVKSITVTEYEERAPLERGAFEEGAQINSGIGSERPKPSFESVIAELTQEYQAEIAETDAFLRELEPLKFKRFIDKNGGKITWIASDYGVSYQIETDGKYSPHSFNWYIITNSKPELWHRKADYMEETLNEIAKSDPELAARVFYHLNDCVGCYGTHCLAKTLYAFNGAKRLSCHGKVMFRMCHGDFRDVREFFRHLNELSVHGNNFETKAHK